MKVLERSYYLERDVVEIARDLLGKLLWTNMDGFLTGGSSAYIMETEAYRAPEDKASHAYNNRRTKRTETMYGEAGHAYIYLNYGIHHLFNIVCGPKEVPHAILIRAGYPAEGLELQLSRRNQSTQAGYQKHIFNGPGKLSQALGITTRWNGMDLCDDASPIRIFDSGKIIDQNKIISGPRVGIDYAEEWMNKEWRFRLQDWK